MSQRLSQVSAHGNPHLKGRKYRGPRTLRTLPTGTPTGGVPHICSCACHTHHHMFCFAADTALRSALVYQRLVAECTRLSQRPRVLLTWHCSPFMNAEVSCSFFERDAGRVIPKCCVFLPCRLHRLCCWWRARLAVPQLLCQEGSRFSADEILRGLPDSS